MSSAMEAESNNKVAQAGVIAALFVFCSGIFLVNVFTGQESLPPIPAEFDKEAFSKSIDAYFSLTTTLSNWAFAMIGAIAFLVKYSFVNDSHRVWRVSAIVTSFGCALASLFFYMIGHFNLLQSLIAKISPFENNSVIAPLQFQFWLLMIGVTSFIILSVLSLRHISRD